MWGGLFWRQGAQLATLGLQGTTNYAHKYPSFGVSVAVLEKAEAVAGVVEEFAGGPGTWIQRTYTGES